MIDGFLKYKRAKHQYEDVKQRVAHSSEFQQDLSADELRQQGARCMDCAVPFCQTGCPVNNQIPDWNDLIERDSWAQASIDLHSTNNFPDFTGKICPAPCEEACTLNLIDQPVMIKSIEQAICERAWQEGWLEPYKITRKTGKSIAIVGSGPAGLAAAQQLARVGHAVTVFEREPRAGGLLRYGIPDFKMEKWRIDRRLEQLVAEGVIFRYNCDIGATGHEFEELVAQFDAVILAIGAEKPRTVPMPGLELDGIYNAMPFLVRQNRIVGEEQVIPEPEVTARDKHVVVIGGGDTASDCIGTSLRQGAKSVAQLDIRLRPPVMEDKMQIWPYWPTKMRTSTSQEEGAGRYFSVVTLGCESSNGNGSYGEGSNGKNRSGNDRSGKVAAIRCAEADDARRAIAGTEFLLPADLVLLAIGFTGPRDDGLLASLDVECTKTGAISANESVYRCVVKGADEQALFAAGDCRRGQSLVVWAIREGRQAARSVDQFLMGSSDLPR